LTDDLLDVSRITRNRLELRRERIDLRSAISGAIETIEPLSEAAGHTVVVDLPGDPIWVYADLTRLAQAFANLLNNAVKYTDRGGHITLTASADSGEAIVRLTDSGIGIDPAFLPSIFDMFVQIEPTNHRPRSGLGIGLALARRLVELHHGTLEACSGGIGKGATFVVRLPAIAAERSQTASPGLRPVAASCRVLVAEDIPDAAEMMRLMIEAMGHDVRVAADGAQAVEMAEAFRPEIALLDIGMPRMDGYEAARQIRAALGGRIVLVALTGWGQEHDRQRAFAAGFDYHVMKPAEPDALESLIASVVSSH